MSLGDWTSWNNRASRPREDVVDVFVPEPPRPEPMEVQEDPLSETGIIRFLRRVAGRNR